MVQVKKPKIREAILTIAQRRFSQQGYYVTSLAQIAKEVGVSTATLYVYFSSKLSLLYAIYDPWIRERLTKLEHSLRQIRTPERRIFALLHALWWEIPAESNGFINNVMQAISTATREDKYQPTLLRWAEKRVAIMLHDALPPHRRKDVDELRIAHVLMMAVDGYVIAHHLHPGLRCDRKTLWQMTWLILK